MLPPEKRKGGPHTGWSDGHDDDDDGADDGDALWERPTHAHRTRFVPRIGVSGTTSTSALHRAFAAHFVRWLIAAGRTPLIVTIDANDWGDAISLRETLAGVLEAAHIVGIEMGSASKTTIPAAVTHELIARFSDADLLLFVGDAMTGNTALTHYAIALTSKTNTPPTADLCVIHTTDPTDRAALEGRRTLNAITPTFAADCIGGRGLDAVFMALWDEVLS